MDTWEEKAEWLRINGYHLIIESLGTLYGALYSDPLWRASIAGEGRRYGNTIGDVVEQVYAWVIEEQGV